MESRRWIITKQLAPVVTGLLLAGIGVWRLWPIGDWLDAFVPFAWIAIATACALAADEVSDWTGDYGWTRETFRVYPADALRWIGWLLLLLAACGWTPTARTLSLRFFL